MRSCWPLSCSSQIWAHKAAYYRDQKLLASHLDLKLQQKSDSLSDSMNMSRFFNDHLNRLWRCTRGGSWFFLSLPLSINTSIYPIRGTRLDLRLFEFKLFFLPSLSLLFSRSLPLLFFCCFLLLGFCVGNGGESLKDEKGSDAPLGKLSVKDRGTDRWNGWVHERMSEERKEERVKAN